MNEKNNEPNPRLPPAGSTDRPQGQPSHRLVPSRKTPRMRLANVLCACALTLTALLALAEGLKDPERPVAVHNEVASVPPTNGRHGGKRYGSSIRNDVRRYGATPSHNMGISEGHRIITRALWRIFDALMQKKDHSQLYGRMTFVEEALKKMISVDTQLEDEIDKLKVRLAVGSSPAGEGCLAVWLVLIIPFGLSSSPSD